MKKIILTLILFSISRIVLGQTNLVPNWSFEIHSSCPNNQSQLYLATPWFFGPSTDLYDSCCTSMACGIPVPVGNVYDTAYPKNGHALIGMHCYYGQREYAQVKLSDTLKSGFCYYAEFYTRRFPMCDWAINNIAMTFSPSPFTTTSPSAPIHVSRYNNPVIKDTSNWVQVSGIFTPIGGEAYVTLGNVRPDSSTNSNIIYNNGIGCSYYLFDAVSVFSINPNGNLPWSYNNVTILLGDSVYIGNHMGGNFNPSWFTYSGNFIANNAGITVTPTVTSSYIVQFTLCGIPRADTVKVTVINNVGIPESSIKFSDLVVSPNPNFGLINILILNKDFILQNFTIKIFDMFNREIKSFKLFSKNQNVPLQDIDDGVYFLQLYQGDKMLVTKKIVKQ